MERWVAEGERLVLDLEETRELHVRIVGGEVSVGGTSGPARLEIDCVEQQPLRVFQADGVLIVDHCNAEADVLLTSIGRPAQGAAVALTVPPDTPVGIKTVSASLLAAGLGGDLDLRTVSGDITGSYLAGAVGVTTVSGEVNVDGVSGSFRGSTVSGELTVTGGCVADFGAKTVSGDVTADLDVKPGGTYQVTTLSGDVAARIPEDAGIAVEVSTLSGQLTSLVPLRGERRSRRRLRGYRGDGSATMRIHTLSGNFALLGREPARQLEVTA